MTNTPTHRELLEYAGYAHQIQFIASSSFSGTKEAHDAAATAQPLARGLRPRGPRHQRHDGHRRALGRAARRGRAANLQQRWASGQPDL
eukprot:1892777-Prymnesium_polylepis.2